MVLDNLNVKYRKLLGSKPWNNIGHKASMFRVHLTKDETLVVFGETRALTAYENYKLCSNEWLET